MSDELNSQLSAFVDDELSPEESELLVRRLCRDETLRHTAASYGIIGDVLRGELAVTAPGEFAASVMMAVEGQTVPATRAAVVEDKSSMRHWGYALAASVALAAIALMTLPGRGPDGLDTISAGIEAGVNETPIVAATVSETEPTIIATSDRPARVETSGQPIVFASPNSLVAAGDNTTDYYNVPIVMPATAENRARLNNLLLQHLYTSGATRQPAGLRNVGFVTQTEAQR